MLADEIEAEPRITVARLERLYQRDRLRKNFVSEVAEMIASRSPALERAGTWLLARAAREAGTLPAGAWETVVEALAGVKGWLGRLQLCQLLARGPALLDADPDAAAHFLRDCAGDAKPFVRAWAITAWHELGRGHPAHRAEARRWLARGRRDPAKSVQARMRRVGND
jgi:hypothetical protein